ncbi:cobalt-zinc-cadmium efflux system membrane fusion protein [Arcticibacter pallidicorallinus]|uniref:Cobalt-zinc-cadmium efflux system membrane fusion protein n=1 Tax=Arcticibacter pallidicorallinus TaxID=1259464 RepID=A0A2T0U382_9SPHI|nr:efflux RND transporter periplasmic adaptor subunit [Arcticibacter pallidicorallinus]PRY52375.1 cobalt-zinc-cadmium efflux system membrane fusion protein [Arcticibacter pallidicorallinus]
MKNIVIIIVSVLFLSCGNNKNTSQKTVSEGTEDVLQLSTEQSKLSELSFVNLQEHSISQTLKLNGVIAVPPQNLVSVGSALGGHVKSVRLLPGMHFRKGDVVAVLEDNQYIQLQQDYLTAKAQLQKASAEYERQEELNRSKASSDKVYQQAKAEYETLRISKQSLEEKLRLVNFNPANVSVDNIRRTARIFAPFDGYVSRIFVNTGKYVSPADILFELVNLKDMHLNLKVFEKDWDKIATGQSIAAYTNNNPDKKYKGEIMLTGKNISEERTVDLYVRFHNADAYLIPGLYMNAEIEIPNNKRYALPQESILTFEGKNYVFKVLDSVRYEFVAVKTGISGNGLTEIIEPQKLKDARIVQKGAYTLLMALKNKAEED